MSNLSTLKTRFTFVRGVIVTFTKFAGSFGAVFVVIRLVRVRILTVGSALVIVSVVSISSSIRILLEPDCAGSLGISAVWPRRLVAIWRTITLSGSFLPWLRHGALGILPLAFEQAGPSTLWRVAQKFHGRSRLRWSRPFCLLIGLLSQFPWKNSIPWPGLEHHRL